MSEHEHEALVRIGEISRRTGVRPDAIRAWERRYGLLDPVRSPGGYRLYSAADEAALRAMRELTGQGLAAAEAARLVRAGGAMAPSPVPPPGGVALDPAAQATWLRSALEAFDEPAANAILDESLAGLSLDRFIEGVVLPAMAGIGDSWERGEVSVGQEHFASGVIRGRLLGLARGWGSGSGPLALLACVPGDLHDLGLICFGLCLRERGWRIVYLGPDTPIETVEEATESLHPRWVVLAASQPDLFTGVAHQLGRVGGSVRLGVGGAGVRSAGSLEGLALLRGGPAGEAEALATGLRDGAEPSGRRLA